MAILCLTFASGAKTLRAYLPLIAFMGLAGLAACGGGSTSTPSNPVTPTPKPTPTPTPPPVTASPAAQTLSVSGTPPNPFAATITFSQGPGLTAQPTTAFSSNTCYNSTAGPQATDIVRSSGGSLSFNSATGQLTQTFGVTAYRAGTCAITVTSSAGGTPGTVTFTVVP
jgi:hypothetical protein